MTTQTDTKSDAVRQFERDGYVLFRNVLDADVIREASDHVAWSRRGIRTFVRSSSTTTS